MKKKSNESTVAGGVASIATGGRPIDRSGAYKPKKRRGDNLLSGAVTEDELSEDELIIMPGRMPKRKTGFVPREQDRTDHEVAMARSDLLAAFKNAKTVYELLKDRSEDVGIEGWVQEKLIKANDYLNAVREYYEEQAVQSDLDGKYGMQSDCGCGPQCNCRPDFESMFENVMSAAKPYNPALSAKMTKAATEAAVYIFVWKGLNDNTFKTELEHEYNITDRDLRDRARNFPAFFNSSAKDKIRWIESKGGKLNYDPSNPIEFELQIPGSPSYSFNIIDMMSGMNESIQLTEKAKSKQQQKFFGMVRALQKGEKIPGASAKLKKTAKSMSKSDVEDFAKTKHSGLPTKVKKK